MLTEELRKVLNTLSPDNLNKQYEEKIEKFSEVIRNLEKDIQSKNSTISILKKSGKYSIDEENLEKENNELKKKILILEQEIRNIEGNGHSRKEIVLEEETIRLNNILKNKLIEIEDLKKIINNNSKSENLDAIQNDHIKHKFIDLERANIEQVNERDQKIIALIKELESQSHLIKKKNLEVSIHS